jgi:hypothetical protein
MTDHVERELLLPATPAEVWDVITSGSWLAEEVELELTPGGDAVFRDGDAVRQGWVEEASAPCEDDRSGRLAFWWAADGEPASRVELTIEQADWEHSRLRVVETRPLEVLDLVGTPFDSSSGQTYGPAMLAAA